MTSSFRRRLAATVAVASLLASLGLVVVGSALPAIALAVGDVTISAPTPFYAADASDGTSDGTFTVTGNLTITSTGSITCNDNATDQPPGPVASGASACPIKIHVTQNLVMQAGSKIQAEDQNDGGNGGAITITVDGDMTMCGQTAGQAGCVAPAGNPGALISSRKIGGAGDTGVGGDITITVGDLSTATGAFYMEGGTTGYGTETGARILASGTGQAGDITITAGRSYFTEPGAVVEAGGPSVAPSEIEQGGKIYIVTGCQLTSEGRVTSKGTDPGADLVHLEGCEVIVRGLVESTGKGHTVAAHPAFPDVAPFNSCDGFSDSLTNEIVHTDKPANATGCIEVWGKLVTIDATGGWAGELNADIGDGGTSGEGWIDIYALSKLTVTDGTGNDRISNNYGHSYFSTYAVHANSIDGSDGTPGTVTAKVKAGPATASGYAFEASATMTAATGHNDGNINDQFVGNGSDGGTIDVEASGTVTLDTAWLNASGDYVGTPPLGGHIVVAAWGTGADLLWRNGYANVKPPTGDIALNACDTIDTTGTNFNGETPATTNVCDPSAPTIPAYVVFNTTVWAICASSTVSGIKFNDLNANGVNDAEPGLGGWTIHLYNASGSVHMTAVTAAVTGAYTFTAVPPGTYTVCEQLPAVTPAWLQTFPTSGANCVSPADPAADNPNPGPLGYSVDLTGGTCCTGQVITGKDFGNIQLASKSGTKWNDVDGDGFRDPGDNGLVGWEFHLYGTAVNGAAVHRTATTDASGLYQFPNLLPGTYTVCEVLQANWSETFPTSVTPGNTACTTAADPDNLTPGPTGYGFTLVQGQAEAGNDFGNFQKPVDTGPPPCLKQTVQDVMTLTYPNHGAPDITVRTWLNESVQAAVDSATDSNNDGYIIVMVIAHSDGSLGGTANQKVVVDKNYGTTKPFGLFGCSVTLTGGGTDPAVWVKSTASSKQISINGRASTIFVMDLHGGNSAIGVEADGTKRYLRNEGATNNTGAGIKVLGDSNTVHNGAATENGGDGIYVKGNSNLLTDTNSMSNRGNGVNIDVGNSNQILKLDVGERGTGNTLDGIHVVGNTNTLQENDVYANSGDGLDIAGNSNILTKNVAGDRTKGNLGNGFLIVGYGNNLTENKASANGTAPNTGDGFNISGGTSALPNLIKNNLSNTGSSGSDLENFGKEWRFLNYIKNNGGGNRADGVLLANLTKGLTNFPASGSTFNYSPAQTAE